MIKALHDLGADLKDTDYFEQFWKDLGNSEFYKDYPGENKIASKIGTLIKDHYREKVNFKNKTSLNIF